ncbi:MAG: hypothetical protein ACTSXG_02965 [Alphaproteobacteria bacterium]
MKMIYLCIVCACGFLCADAFGMDDEGMESIIKRSAEKQGLGVSQIEEVCQESGGDLSKSIFKIQEKSQKNLEASQISSVGGSKLDFKANDFQEKSEHESQNIVSEEDLENFEIIQEQQEENIVGQNVQNNFHEIQSLEDANKFQMDQKQQEVVFAYKNENYVEENRKSVTNSEKISVKIEEQQGLEDVNKFQIVNQQYSFPLFEMPGTNFIGKSPIAKMEKKSFFSGKTKKAAIVAGTAAVGSFVIWKALPWLFKKVLLKK